MAYFYQNYVFLSIGVYAGRLPYWSPNRQFQSTEREKNIYWNNDMQFLTTGKMHAIYDRKRQCKQNAE